MQIHELNTFAGTLGTSDYFATDNGDDTSKVSATDLFAPLNARIDNIIAGEAPSAQEIIDARLGADGTVYSSLGKAIRSQVDYLKGETVNLFRYWKDTLTSAGVTYTVNSDQSVTIAGTPTSNGVLILSQDITLPAGSYVFGSRAGLAVGVTTLQIRKIVNGADAGALTDATISHKLFTITETTTVRFRLSYYNNVALNNIIYPMLLAGTTWDSNVFTPPISARDVIARKELLKTFSGHYEPSTIDLNDMTKAGFYNILSANNYANLPVGVAGLGKYLMVETSTENPWTIQKLYVTTNNRLSTYDLYARVSNYSGNWLPWKKVYSFTDIDVLKGSLGGYQVKAINHRGYNSAPENTLPAYRLSKQNNFEYVETDVCTTSDGQFVLLHDDTINRTARNADGSEIAGEVYISQITYAQALEYDFGIWKSEVYAGTKIPTFTQFIELCRNLSLHPYIELKASADFSENQVIEMLNIVKSYGMERNCTWISFDTDALGYIKANDAKARIGVVAFEVTSATVTTASSLKTNDNDVFIDGRSSDVTSAVITMCKNAGIPLEVWTVDSVSAINSLDGYITGVTSNNQIAGQVLVNANIGNEYGVL